MAKTRFSTPNSLRGDKFAKTKLIQRGLYFRSWFLDRSIGVLCDADHEVEQTILALGNGQSDPQGAIGIALDLPDENTFFKLIGHVDLRFAGLILGGVIDVSAILTAFPHRRVRTFKHEKTFPFRLIPSEDQDGEVAVVGELPLPEWPRIGLTMPVYENAAGARRAAVRLLETYPGVLDIAIVANGSSDATLNELQLLEGEVCDRVWVARETENLGFPGGVNVGLQELWTSAWYDIFGIAHDDIVPSLNSLSELADAFETLHNLGQRPAVVGPVSNRAEGLQNAELSGYTSEDEFEQRSAEQFSGFRRSADEVERVGSHLMLIDAEALSDIGGFDLLFGRGFFSEDDWCLRARLAGYRIWVAPGAYVHHEGAKTFIAMAADQPTTVERNQALFVEKWRHSQPHENIAFLAHDVYLPLRRKPAESQFNAIIHGEPVDLVNQASPIEFAAFVTACLEDLPRAAREQVLKALRDAATGKPTA